MGLALVLITAVLYWQVRHFDFVQFDDDDYVFANQTVSAGLSWYGLAWSFVDAHASNWHPVTWISHMLDCQLFGLHPGPHHLMNVLLHCANSALLFLFFRTLTGAFWRSALVAALFAWHPLRVESVAWISERKDVLSGLFFILTLWTYVIYARRAGNHAAGGGPPAVSPRSNSPEPVPGDWRSGWRLRLASPPAFYKLSLGFFALGLLSKPMLVTVPCILLLLDFWPLNRFQSDPSGGSFCRRLLREKIPFFLLSMLVGVLTFLSQKSGGAVIALKSEGIASRLENVLANHFNYLEKLVWPRDLSFLYLRPATPPVWTVVLGALVLVGVSALAFMNRRRRPYLAVGWLWFIVMLLPVSGLVQVGLQSIADRYTYLPGIGLGLIAAWGALEAADKWLPRSVGQPLLVSIACLALLACAVMTRHQLAFWQNTETLMQHALQLNPDNYVAHQDLGVYYSKRGELELARAHRQRVRELDPGFRQTSDDATNSVSPRLKAGSMPEQAGHNE